MKGFLLGIMAVALLTAAGCEASGGENTAAATGSALPDSAQSTGEPVASATETPAAQGTAAPAAAEMTVSSSGIAGGYIGPAYGANGEVKENGKPVLSLPLEISGAPEDAVCFAVYMDDPDAKPLCGYNWVHWMAVNIGESSIPEDFSRTAQDSVVQGKNDSGTVGYAGPMPPDKDHTYVITVYALDEALDLSEGFSKEEFAQAIEGHMLASATIEGIYKK